MDDITHLAEQLIRNWEAFQSAKDRYGESLRLFKDAIEPQTRGWENDFLGNDGIVVLARLLLKVRP